tara:strand:+ start:1045 stop:1581 length:537 start_codon:yes stop_codon:yes gene_type:complete
MPEFEKSQGFKMKGMSFGNESPLKQSIEVKKGESYKNYLNRAFKETKDPYAQDVGSKKWHASQTKQHAQDAKKTRRGIYKGIKSKISSGLSKVGFSDKAIQSMSRGLTTAKQIGTKIAKSGAGRVVSKFAGPVGVALTAYDAVTTVPKVVKATQKHLKTEAKERSTKSAQTLFRGPKY